MLTIPTKLYKHCYVLGRLKEYLKLKKKKNREREREDKHQAESNTRALLQETNKNQFFFVNELIKS